MLCPWSVVPCPLLLATRYLLLTGDDRGEGGTELLPFALSAFQGAGRRCSASGPVGAMARAASRRSQRARNRSVGVCARFCSIWRRMLRSKGAGSGAFTPEWYSRCGGFAIRS